jgi:hypothetical protein
MFIVAEFSRAAQRAACMLMAGLIVSASLALGAYRAYSVAHPGFTVTIEQLP